VERRHRVRRHCDASTSGTCRPSLLPEFEDVSRQTVLAHGVGLPGRVWASGEPAWIPDVVADPNFPRAGNREREGLHGAFALPILTNRRVVGVMEFFSREIREPDEDLLRMLTQVGAHIGQFMERKRAEEELERFFTLSLDLLCLADSTAISSG
jgi:GAF domain-containing protein